MKMTKYDVRRSRFRRRGASAQEIVRIFLDEVENGIGASAIFFTATTRLASKSSGDSVARASAKTSASSTLELAGGARGTR